jgi:hypothetical protein
MSVGRGTVGSDETKQRLKGINVSIIFQQRTKGRRDRVNRRACEDGGYNAFDTGCSHRFPDGEFQLLGYYNVYNGVKYRRFGGSCHIRIQDSPRKLI